MTSGAPAGGGGGGGGGKPVVQTMAQKAKRKISLPWFRQSSVQPPHPTLARQHTIDTPSSFHARLLRLQPSISQVMPPVYRAARGMMAPLRPTRVLPSPPWGCLPPKYTLFSTPSSRGLFFQLVTATRIFKCPRKFDYGGLPNRTNFPKDDCNRGRIKP